MSARLAAIAPTFSDLAAEYLASAQYLSKAARTQEEYAKILAKLVDLIGDMPLSRLGSEVGQEYAYALLEKWRKTPRHANHTLAVLSVVCSFGVRRRRLLVNPVIGVER